jgi:hypothetical protein
MHSAASWASFWLTIALDLNEDQDRESLCTVAGVHYPTTKNIAGLDFGQQIMTAQLADHLAH